MRRIFGMALACGVVFCGASASRAQDVTGGDPVGFGKKGISNAFGYGVKGLGKRGMMPDLYMPVDRADGPSVYFNEAFSPLNGAPLPSVSPRGWRIAPSWGSSPRETRLGLFRGRLAARRDGVVR